VIPIVRLAIFKICYMYIIFLGILKRSALEKLKSYLEDELLTGC